MIAWAHETTACFLAMIIALSCAALPMWIVYRFGGGRRATPPISTQRQLIVCASALLLGFALYELTSPSITILQSYGCRHATVPAVCRGEEDTE